MSPETAKEIALEIIKMIDYDMWKECEAEPEEYSQLVESIMYKIGDVFNDGYHYAEIDYNIAEKH